MSNFFINYYMLYTYIHMYKISRVQYQSNIFVISLDFCFPQSDLHYFNLDCKKKLIIKNCYN